MHRMALVLPLVALACSPDRRPGPEATVALASCRVEGLSQLAECGRVQVFEDQKHDRGPTIALRVVRLPAAGSAARPDPLRSRRTSTDLIIDLL